MWLVAQFRAIDIYWRYKTMSAPLQSAAQEAAPIQMAGSKASSKYIASVLRAEWPAGCTREATSQPARSRTAWRAASRQAGGAKKTIRALRMFRRINRKKGREDDFRIRSQTGGAENGTKVAWLG